MDEKKSKNETDSSTQHKITLAEFKEFTNAQTYEEQLKILHAHAEKNKKRKALVKKRLSD